MERLWFRLISELCFSSKVSRYGELVAQWAGLTHSFSGWSLTEIQELTPRERSNWITIARGLGKLKR
jgi:hypothetical protein